MENLILVPLDDSILFPGMSATIAVETGDEERVLLVPRTEGEFAASAPSPTWSSACASPAAAPPSP